MNKIKTTPSEDFYLKQISETDTHSEGVFCKLCNDSGYSLVQNENGIDKAVICECDKSRMWHQAFADAGITREYYDKTLESTWNINQDAYGNDLGPNKEKKRIIGQFMKKYINLIPALTAGIKLTVHAIKDNKKVDINVDSLLLLGEVGSGKTLLASIAVQETIKKGLSAKMYYWNDLNQILSQYENKTEQDEIAQEFKAYDLIVIDSIQDYANKTPCFIVQLDRICHERIRSGKPIMITAFTGYHKILSGYHWKSLLEQCYVINLPGSYKPNKENEEPSESGAEVKSRIKY